MSTTNESLNLGVNDSPLSVVPDGASPEQIHATPEVRMNGGQKLVILGFVISVLGIVLYCMPIFSANPTAGTSPGSMLLIGVGVLCWLVGAVRYLNAAIDSNGSGDPEDL